MHSAVRAVQVSVHLCVRKSSEKNFLTFFQIIEDDTDPVAGGSSNQLHQESGFVFETTSEEKGTEFRREACGLLRAVK